MHNQTRRLKVSGWYYKLELSKKRALWGWIFLTPWLIGFLVFFLKPLIESIIYSFNSVKVLSEGGISLEFVGLKNYIEAFTVDTIFNRLIITMVTTTLPQVFIVIIFSLLAAILLNGKYFGRSVARTIFFIPIIMGTNIAESTLVGNDVISLEISGATGGRMAFGSKFIIDILSETGLPTELVSYVTGAVSGIFSILAISGVPILIFLAGLQSISPSLYEVAKIEGSTGYETFWKVTFPMISPMILVCAIYSIIDAFFRHSIMVDGSRYAIIRQMQNIAFSQAKYGLSAAMTTIYLIVSVSIIAIVSYLISRVVFYYD
ncbi:MAG: sugar ABC transporter permease [Epulopiscium sp.]|nr:sugar ABC transporter permease [Candidatus Epulonipiscium sp.]